VNGQYSNELYHSSFIGFYPVDKPEIVCYVLISKPKGKYYGGMVAAPVFKNINEKILALGQTIKKESKQQSDIKTVQNENQENKSDYYPVEHQIDRGVKKVENIFVSNTKKNIMPDLIGMTIKEALLIMNEMGIQCSISGSGLVTKQSIPPGTIIKSRKVCRITCSQLITEEASIY